MSRLFKALLGAYHYTAPSDIDQSYLSTALRQLAKICPDKETVEKCVFVWRMRGRVVRVDRGGGRVGGLRGREEGGCVD